MKKKNKQKKQTNKQKNPKYSYKKIKSIIAEKFQNKKRNKQSDHRTLRYSGDVGLNQSMRKDVVNYNTVRK